MLDEKEQEKYWNHWCEVVLTGQEKQILYCRSSYIPGKIRFQKTTMEKPKVYDLKDVESIDFDRRPKRNINYKVYCGGRNLWR